MRHPAASPAARTAPPTLPRWTMREWQGALPAPEPPAARPAPAPAARASSAATHAWLPAWLTGCPQGQMEGQGQEEEEAAVGRGRPVWPAGPAARGAPGACFRPPPRPAGLVAACLAARPSRARTILSFFFKHGPWHTLRHTPPAAGRSSRRAAPPLLQRWTATADQIKAAYRKSALLHHPDKQASLGPLRRVALSCGSASAIRRCQAPRRRPEAPRQTLLRLPLPILLAPAPILVVCRAWR